MENLNDPFDDPLAAAFQRPTGGDARRSAILAQTVGVLRFRRRLKRCALAASLLGCYLAGITTMSLLRPGAEQAQPAIAKSQQTSPDLRHVSTNPSKNQVAAKKSSRFESWRNVGDRHLLESGDVAQAVAGYSKAIKLASNKERAISPDQDNWLVMALKLDAHSKEKRHAYP